MAATKEVVVPDLGQFHDVPVIEVLVRPGDTVEPEAPLIVLESDKATLDVPAPFGGRVKDILLKVGDKVDSGTPVALFEVTEAEPAAEKPAAEAAKPEPAPQAEAPAAAPPQPPPQPATPPPAAAQPVAEPKATGEHPPHASPSVRRFARELGADLGRVRGSGPKGRILKEDVQAWIKERLQRPESPGGLGLAWPEPPAIDFSQFGPIETQPLSRIKKLSGANLHRNWVSIPHVTQHDVADVTELDEFRSSLKPEAERNGVRLSFLPFLMKAVVAALKAHPQFNASLENGGENLVLKRYYHLGIAVDTADGLMVPVVRDVDQKGLYQLAAELADLSARARSKKLKPQEMQGASFSISSLGGIGGDHFTPIINAPEVAILGVSRTKTQPVWRDGQFVPRQMLPLSLSYDHRVIDGAEGARFIVYLSQVLGDLRRVLL